MKLIYAWIFFLAKLSTATSTIIANETADAEASIAGDDDMHLSNTKDEILADAMTENVLEMETNHNKLDVAEPLVQTSLGFDYPYSEVLKINPLKNNYLLTSFEFHSESNEFPILKNDIDADSYLHYTVFPKSISPILDLTGTKKLFLRFTHGFWDSQIWGELPNSGFNSGGNGVEMWSLIEAEDEAHAFKQWKLLTNQLSGLFCASIDYIDSTKTTYPYNANIFLNSQYDIPPIKESNSLFLMRGSLANEPICTENLTPFIKMLPTRGKSGLSSLLDGHKVFDSYWSSMSLDINTVCGESNKCHNVMDINIATVVNVPKLIARNKNPIPKPSRPEDLRCDPTKRVSEYECFILPDSSEVSFLLSDLFGKSINGHNQLSTSAPTKILIEGVDTEFWSCAIKENEDFFSTDSNVFELRNSNLYDVYLTSKDSSRLVNKQDVPILVSRALTGYSQDKGGLRIAFTNPSLDNDIDVIYIESLPWFMRLYLSSLKLEVNNDKFKSDVIIKSTHFVPAVDREAPLNLEYQLFIPRNTTVSMFFQFDKPLLKFEEYPPDANHGFEIESALVVLLDHTGNNYYLRTPTLLLTLSTPDFSMPYNVIIFTSTVMALCFTTMYSLLTKRFVTVEEAKEAVKKKKVQVLLSKLKGKFKKN